jgi:OmcA/MtrC family decaheme c-type cytochrome
LQAEITAVAFSEDGKPMVSVTMTDDQGRPLTPEALEGYGFTIAQVTEDTDTELTHLQSMLVREVEGQPYTINGESFEPAQSTAEQAFADNDGEWASVGEGYVYTFANTLTAELDTALTTVVGLYAYKDGRETVANDLYTFVPGGGEPRLTREVVSTEACNGCHGTLAFHGGVRREVGLCASCHTSQTTDPETGNSVEFRVLIHKLHSGERLPSVESGEPYRIIGFRQSDHDYSMGAWPQDLRNCTTCHKGGADSDNYKTMPQTAACSSCHDDVNPVTGENHPGGGRADGSCVNCHQPEGDEFDSAVASAHLLPLNSQQIAGLNLEIISVDNVAPGSSPVVTFTSQDNNGNSIAPGNLDYLAVTLAGPTSGYVMRHTETIYRSSSEEPPAISTSGDVFSYTMAFEIPEDASGSLGIGLEGYVMEILNDLDEPVRVAAFNPVTYVALNGDEPAPRRQVVSLESCNSCHESLALHGGIRQNPEYCVLCHNTTATDEAVRPAESMPPNTINFPVLIHRIHRGKEGDEQPYIVFGFRGSEHDFSNVGFPRNLANCESCHLPGSYAMAGISESEPTLITQNGELVKRIWPIQAVCTACHDSRPAVGHSELQTTASGIETCEVCHSPGSEFDITEAHR